MAEVLFYHLTERTLEQTLPPLVEKCLERNWHVVIQGSVQERLEALDAHLWTFSDESFLPHGMIRDGTEGEQPVWLTTGEDNPNAASVRFMIDAATPPDLGTYVRGVYVFDGHDEASLQHARERWQVEKAAGHAVTYWQQAATGGWQRKA
jgi:DNA polymerase III subunit chi